MILRSSIPIASVSAPCVLSPGKEGFDPSSIFWDYPINRLCVKKLPPTGHLSQSSTPPHIIIHPPTRGLLLAHNHHNKSESTFEALKHTHLSDSCSRRKIAAANCCSPVFGTTGGGQPWGGHVCRSSYSVYHRWCICLKSVRYLV